MYVVSSTANKRRNSDADEEVQSQRPPKAVCSRGRTTAKVIVVERGGSRGWHAIAKGSIRNNLQAAAIVLALTSYAVAGYCTVL
jgi:hypothetical protein